MSEKQNLLTLSRNIANILQEDEGLFLLPKSTANSLRSLSPTGRRINGSQPATKEDLWCVLKEHLDPLNVAVSRLASDRIFTALTGGEAR